MSNSSNHVFALKRTQAAAGLEVWQADLGTMPLAPADRPLLAAAYHQLLSQAASLHHLTPVVWLEASHIYVENASQLIGPHAREWVPRTGFGIRPDGEPPRLWTNDDFSGSPFGHKPPLFDNQVFEISRSAGNQSAIDLMAGRGVLILTLLQDSAEVYKRASTALLTPMVKEESFKAYAYFFPLLTESSANHAQIATWMGGASIYMRELFDERKLLILSRVPLNPVLQGLGAERKSDAEWHLSSAGQAKGTVPPR